MAAADHPARRLVVLGVLLALGFATVAVLRPPRRGAAEVLALYRGESVRLVVRTDPGAAPDDLEWFEPVTVVELAPRDGVPSVRLRLDGMTPLDDPAGEAHLWLPVDRVAEVWVGPKRVFRDRG